MAEILKVIKLPKSVYYYQVHHDLISRDVSILSEIKAIKEANLDYSYRRVTLKLHNQGFVINHKKVQKIMHNEHLQSIAYGKKTRKYNSYKGTVDKITPNRLHHRFMADRPYQKLTADVTKLHWGKRSMEERIYLEPIMDLFSGEILSFNISSHPTVEFAVKPLHEALNALPSLPYRTTVHTDQGFQYQNQQWVQELKDHHVFQSMSRKATCLDNAAMESFFHLLKCATVHQNRYQTREELEVAVPRMDILL